MIPPLIDNIGRDPDKDLSIEEEFPNCVTIKYTPSQQDIDSSIYGDDEKKDAIVFQRELMMINGQDEFRRCNIRDVRIYTFDELLTELKDIYVA